MTSQASSADPASLLDLSPAPGAAPPVRRVVRHGLTEATLLARNGEQLLLALVIPATLLILGPLLGDRFGLARDHWGASVLALAVWSSAFTSTAIATGFERRYGVLERLAATPLGRTGLVQGKVLAVLLVIIGQVVVLAVIAGVLGWRPRGGPVATLIMLGCAALAVTTFVALALIMAGTLRAEATLALANLIYLIMAVAGGLVLPASSYPGALATAVKALPTGAWGEMMRAWSAGQLLWWPLVVLAVWAVGTVALAQKVFRWMS